MEVTIELNLNPPLRSAADVANGTLVYDNPHSTCKVFSGYYWLLHKPKGHNQRV
jgi:hypothetical protein